MNSHHLKILHLIRENADSPTQHTFLEGYLGTRHTRYAINNPRLRLIAKEWVREHKTIKAAAFQKLITSLVKGESATEKMMAGMLLDVATPEQRSFDPKLFDIWLDYLEGWAEVDTLCTGTYPALEILHQWTVWKKLLITFSKSKNIHKRRASLVFLGSAVRKHDDLRLAALVIANIERLKIEKEILITKAISWLLRDLVKHHTKMVSQYISRNKNTLPAIAIRETLTKLKTGKKTPSSERVAQIHQTDPHH